MATQAGVGGWPGAEARREQRERIGRVFYFVLLFCVLFGLLMLMALLVDLAFEGAEWITPTLFTQYHSRFPEQAGMKSAIVGSLLIVLMTALLSFPVGVGAAIYLEEYAPKHWLTDFININISNLAGVPSIVFGLLGLAAFARFFGALQATSPLFLLFSGEPAPLFGTTVDLPFSLFEVLGMSTGTRGGVEFRLLDGVWQALFGRPGWLIKLPFETSLLAGGLTMMLLSLPTVIIAAREAIRAVPGSIREAAFGLGATRWQVVSRQVLPVAFPGILTGMILSMGRTIGETAPLLILGAYTYVPFLPESIWDRFTVMPIQIYNWISLPQDEYRFHLSAAGIIVLIAILLSLNALAVFLRNRFEKRF
jgi:phosphate transport system permease protein